MTSEGTFWLVGGNQSGIKSAGKRLTKYFDTSSKTDSARHCVLFTASQAKDTGPFSIEDYREKWMLGSPPDELKFVSLPGVFAHGRLDRGTELLLQVVADLKNSQRPSGQVLDFGCGIGVIGLTVAVFS